MSCLNEEPRKICLDQLLPDLDFSFRERSHSCLTLSMTCVLELIRVGS